MHNSFSFCSAPLAPAPAPLPAADVPPILGDAPSVLGLFRLGRGRGLGLGRCGPGVVKGVSL
jgi:hypothetical protein